MGHESKKAHSSLLGGLAKVALSGRGLRKSFFGLHYRKW
jgi:hypothetical protein